MSTGYPVDVSMRSNRVHEENDKMSLTFTLITIPK